MLKKRIITVLTFLDGTLFRTKNFKLVVFGCGGPTIDKDSDEGDYIERSRGKNIISYKGVPFSGNLTGTYENGQLEEKRTYKEGRIDGVSEYYKDGQLKSKKTYKDGKEDGSEYYDENGELEE